MTFLPGERHGQVYHHPVRVPDQLRSRQQRLDEPDVGVGLERPQGHHLYTLLADLRGTLHR